MSSLSVVDEYLKSKSIESMECRNAIMVVDGKKQSVIRLHPKPVAYKINGATGYKTECYPTIFDLLPLNIALVAKQLNYDLFKKLYVVRTCWTGGVES